MQVVRLSRVWFPWVRLTVWAALACGAAAPSGARGQAASAEAPVTLKPGDVVQIEIWREKDLSGHFLVDELGQVVFPLLGTIRVTEIPIGELRHVLIGRYQEQLRNPSIVVTPLRRVNVMGEVAEPGMYEVDPTITLAGAIALAGGVTPSGDTNKIEIVREGDAGPVRIDPRATLHSVDIRSGDQVVVLRRSWFERNSTFVVSLMLSVSSIIIGLLSN